MNKFTQNLAWLTENTQPSSLLNEDAMNEEGHCGHCGEGEMPVNTLYASFFPEV